MISILKICILNKEVIFRKMIENNWRLYHQLKLKFKAGDIGEKII